jgi:hypothetical protein
MVTVTLFQQESVFASLVLTRERGERALHAGGSLDNRHATQRGRRRRSGAVSRRVGPSH